MVQTIIQTLAKTQGADLMIIAKFNHWHCLSEDDVVAVGVGGDEAGAGVQTAAANKSTSDRTGHWAWPTGRCCGSL